MPMVFRAFNIATVLLLATTVLLDGCGERTTSASAPQQSSEQTPEQLFAKLLKDAESGNVDAQAKLGAAFFFGKGTPIDIAKAVEWWQKAAVQGEPHAQYNLGVVYSKGEGAPKDAAKAVEWWQKAAVQGNADAQSNLGRAYIVGEGVPKDAAKAVEWWQKAAVQGHASAQTKLGLSYSLGEGVPKDAAKAVEWWQKAADQGNAIAQDNLGMAYFLGEGVPKDAVKAVEWCQKAAAQGDADAQSNLGRAYFLGEGAPADKVLGYAWTNLAAARGNTEAIRVRPVIEPQLSREELSEAQRLSSAWKPGQTLAREGRPAGSAGTEPARAPGSLSKRGTGTLFIVNPTGQAVTNDHVIQGCTEVRLEGREGVVKVVTEDVVNDLALIQVPGGVKSAAPIVSDPGQLRQGEDIVVFGFPLNSVLSSGGNLSPGVVSALTGLGNNTNQIQLTAPIQPGSSGSPVLNKKGEVVGVVSMKLSDSTMVRATGQVGQNVNFAVSGQTLKTFLDTHHVKYSTGSFISFNKSTADLADAARKWTMVVECWK